MTRITSTIEAAEYWLPKNIDWVFHLAAKTGLQPWSSFQEYLETNVFGTQRLLEACRQYCPGLKRFVYASTSSVYGREAVGDETLERNPISPYGWTKMVGEEVCSIYMRRFNLPITALRYFSVYGPRQRPGMAIRRWIDQALDGKPLEVCKGSLEHTRSFTYVDDVVEATLLAAQRDEAVGEVFNVAGEDRVRIEDAARTIFWACGGSSIVKAPIAECLEPRDGDQVKTGGVTKKAQNLLGWTPKTGWSEGLRRQVEWQRSLREEK